MATFPAITGIAAYVIAGFTPHVISNNASFNCAFSSANVCACARACSKCISKYAHFARISRSISRLRARDAADASRFAARRFARLCGAPIVDVIGPTRARGTAHASGRVLGMNQRQTLVASRSIARSTAGMTPNARFRRPPRAVVRARSSARARMTPTPRGRGLGRGADATRPIIVRETCHVACTNTSPPEGLCTSDIRAVCVRDRGRDGVILVVVESFNA